MGQRMQLSWLHAVETVEKPLDLRFLSSNMRIAVLSYGVHDDQKRLHFHRTL